MALTMEQVDGVTVIHIPDKFVDALNAPSIKAEIQSQLKPKMQLVLDLSHVEFLDSSGMGAILACMRQLTSMGGQLKLGGVTNSVRSLFELVRFHRIMDIFSTTDEAIRGFSNADEHREKL